MLLVLALAAPAPQALAQAAPPSPAAPPARWLEPQWGAPKACLAQLNQLRRPPQEAPAEDLLLAARLLEAGDCVVRDNTRALRFYAQASQLGSAEAARQLALRFGQGRDVTQSYANAGAWLAGKGTTDEAIESWDYSIGFAYTLARAVLDRLRFPRDGWPPGQEISFAIEVNALEPTRVRLRMTGEPSAAFDALRAAVTAALQPAATLALAQLAPRLPEHLVEARVTLPAVVRRAEPERFEVTEREPVLR